LTPQIAEWVVRIGATCGIWRRAHNDRNESEPVIGRYAVERPVLTQSLGADIAQDLQECDEEQTYRWRGCSSQDDTFCKFAVASISQKPDIRSSYSANIFALRMLSWMERSSFVVGVSCYDASSPLVSARQFKRLV